MGRPRIIKKEMERRVAERFPDETFEILEYQSSGQPGKIRCCNCNKIIKIKQFSNFLAPSKNFGCSSCQNQLMAKREDNWEKIKKYYDITFTKVVDTHKRYQFKCKNCNHIRETTVQNLMKNFDCGCITGVKRSRTSKEFINEVNQYSIDGTYDLVDEYSDQLTRILLRHSCGFIFKVKPADIIHGQSRCPRCRKKRSKGELFIENLLKEFNIDFQVEKHLDNSRQRFDFYMENKKHKIAIEYNYIEVDFFGGTLEEYQARDNKKKLYCEQHDIELYTIPYTMTNEEIRNYISEIINKFND